MKVEKISRTELFKLEKDYIFHGSPTLFNIGKPHKAKCDTKNPLNEQYAIYGANDLRFAVLFAFEKLPKENFSWRAINHCGEYIAELKGSTYIDENAKGYLYCYDKTKFKPTSKASSQYVSFEELKPKRIFEVFYKEYKDFFVKNKEQEVTL